MEKREKEVSNLLADPDLFKDKSKSLPLLNEYKQLKEELEAQKGIYYQGQKVGSEADHTTRFNSVKLLADVLGIRQTGPSTVNLFSDHSESKFLIIAASTEDALEQIRKTDPKEIERKWMEKYGYDITDQNSPE